MNTRYESWGQVLTRFVRHTTVPDIFLTLSQRLFLSVVVMTLILALSWVNPWPVSIMAGALTLVAIRAYAKGQDLRMVLHRKLLLGIAGFLVWLIIYIQFSTVIGQNAGVAAITMLVSLKLFEMDRRRDGLILLFLAQVLVMGLFFVSQEIISALCAFGMEVMLFTGQRALFQSPHASWTLPWKGIRQSGALIFGALILAIILFFVFPRPSEPIWNVGVPQTTTTTGLSESMSPGSMDSLVRSGEIAFSVEMQLDIPPPSKRYWRGPTMTNYRNGVWQISHDVTTANVKLNEKVLENYQTTTGKAPWQYKILMEPSFRRWVYGLETAYQISPNSGYQVDGLWQANEVISKPQVFHGLSMDIPSRLEPNISDRQELLRFTREPRYVEPRLRALAENWRRESLKESGETPFPNDDLLARYPSPLPPKSARLVIDKALNYFREQNFVYALDNVRLPNENPMDAFLFDIRRGFCESYAGAFALLMRSAGIPSRIVTGYQGGEYNSMSDLWVIRQSDAHAWNEVWLESEGWVRVDPTAAIAPERIETSLAATLANARGLGLLAQANNLSFLRQSLLMWEGAKTQWNRWVVLYDDQTQNSLLSKLSLPNLTRYHLSIIATLIVLGFFVLVYWRNRPQALSITLENQWWQSIIRQLQQRQINVDTSMPPHEVARMVQAEALQNTSSSKLMKKTLTSHSKNLQAFVDRFIALKYHPLNMAQKNALRQQLKRLYKKI